MKKGILKIASDKIFFIIESDLSAQPHATLAFSSLGGYPTHISSLFYNISLNCFKFYFLYLISGFFGKLMDGGKLDIDAPKLAKLRKLSVLEIDYCRDCFAKWHCAGDWVTPIFTETAVENVVKPIGKSLLIGLLKCWSESIITRR